MKPLNIKTPPKPPYEGWTIESHTPVGEVDLSKVIFHLEPEQKEGSIEGEVLRERLKGKKCLDGALLDYLLEHKDLIPDSWKNERFIYFWGTIYRGSDGSLYVRYLYWVGSQWNWSGYWLGLDWGGDDPAALSQVALGASDTQSSDDPMSLSLKEAIEIVKGGGYQVSKIM